MAWGKRRKGKTSSGRSTPVPPPKEDAEKEEVPEAEKDEKRTEYQDTTRDNKDSNGGTEGKEGDELSDTKDTTGESKKASDTAATDSSAKETSSVVGSEQATAPSPPPVLSPSKKGANVDEADLVLTSEKRRGIYECDYCHSDISQLPRIRCGVCTDFDLCLDCFATTDHSAAIARMKAAATAHSELQSDGIVSTMVAGISSAAVNHDDTHGYRVCDSTRYPMFGSARFVMGNFNNNNLATASSKVTSEVSDSMETNTMNTNEQSATSTATTATAATTTAAAKSDYMLVSDDPKSIWTAEEDLRLIDAIQTHGLGNWADISDAVGGNGSVGKTPKRCMERYVDDFLGRYGRILPQYTIVEDTDDGSIDNAAIGDNMSGGMLDVVDTASMVEDETIRASKRRQAQLLRSPSALSSSSQVGGRARKRYKVVPTESLPGYDEIWPSQFIPAVEGVHVGQEVARDLSTKNELIFVKATGAVPTMEEADKIRKEWEDTKMYRIGAPTVLPPRPEDTATLPGAELLGFMPRRGEFDIEYENDAETALADMEFTTVDSEADKQLKVQVLQIYYQKQEEREKRKTFILSRNLYDYRKYVKEEHDLPQDERDLIHRMRLFERFHTPQEHKQFIDDIIKAKRLRKEIAKLQMYRRIGIRSLAEAEKYELDKSRRQFHKIAQAQKAAEAKHAAAVVAATGLAPPPVTTTAATTTTSGSRISASSLAAAAAMAGQVPEPVGESLWKQYRTSDRKVRRSINRTGSDGMAEEKLDAKFQALAEQQPAGTKEHHDEKDSGDYVGPKGDESKPETIDADDPQTPDKKADDAIEMDDTKESSGTTNERPEDGQPSEEAETKGEDIDMKVTHKAKEGIFDIAEARGYDLLNRREVELCLSLKIYPAQYLEVKKALIHESLSKGLLDKEGPGSGRRVVVKMDVERRGNVVDFMLRAGWISSHLAEVARTVTPPPVSSD